MKQQELRKQLEALAEPAYGAFNANLRVSTRHIWGIRMPKLRNLAKQLYKAEGIAALEDFFSYQAPSFEEVGLACMLFGLAGAPLSWLDRIRPYNDSWATNDCLASGLKHLKTDSRFYPYLVSLLSEQEPYDRRLGIVALMDNYMDQEHLSRTLEHLSNVETDDHYYVIMALGWAFATAYCKDKEAVLPYLQVGKLSEPVRRKAIQKCIESLMVSDEDKAYLRNLRRAP